MRVQVEPVKMARQASANLDSGDRRKRMRSRNVSYILPKDVMEGERLDLQHHLFRYVLQSDFVAPLQEEEIANILDVGSGTGIWGEEMALEFPRARVVNLDLEAAAKTVRADNLTEPPPNWHFVQGNVLQSLPFPDDLFDFTHQRMLVAAIPTSAWPAVVGELIRVTRPGGWVELFESPWAPAKGGPVTDRLITWTTEMLARRGMNPGAMGEARRCRPAGGSEGSAGPQPGPSPGIVGSLRRRPSGEGLPERIGGGRTTGLPRTQHSQR